jgi:hypothetical protein
MLDAWYDVGTSGPPFLFLVVEEHTMACPCFSTIEGAMLAEDTGTVFTISDAIVLLGS